MSTDTRQSQCDRQILALYNAMGGALTATSSACAYSKLYEHRTELYSIKSTVLLDYRNKNGGTFEYTTL